MSVIVEYEHTFKQALATGLNLFLGSGFAVLAKDAEGHSLPMGSDLALELIGKFRVPSGSELTLTQVSTIVEHSQRNELQDYLKKRFSVKDFDPRYLCLDKICVRTILTTNVDDLLYKIYASSKTHYLNDLDIKGPIFNDRRAIGIVTLHGSVLDDNRTMSFSAFDVAAAFRTDPDRWHFLTESIQTYPTLFWGYSMGDSGTLEALSPQSIKARPQKEKWIILAGDTSEGTIQYFKALGFYIVTANTSEMLDYLTSVDIAPLSIAPAGPKVLTRDLFKQEAIPDITEVPVRPIMEFYLGAPPSWHDIFSGMLHRTAHYTAIQDSINSGKHTIVIGLPACGKTTLMMQVAQGTSFSGHKLVCDAPTIEKAQLITNRLDGQKALIFVDNFADDADAFAYLMDQPNIFLAGFDRDYSFEIVSHRLDRTRCNILDVTELSAVDIQEILSKIPLNIRNPYTKVPEMEEGKTLSLFELIESSITKPSVMSRLI